MPKDIHPMPLRTPRGGFFLPPILQTQKRVSSQTPYPLTIFI